MYIFRPIIIRVVRVVKIVKMGFSCSSNWFGPEKDTLGSESPDEDTSISRCGWNILLKRYEKSMHASNVAGKDRLG